MKTNLEKWQAAMRRLEKIRFHSHWLSWVTFLSAAFLFFPCIMVSSSAAFDSWIILAMIAIFSRNSAIDTDNAIKRSENYRAQYGLRPD
jgi:hypothetical protein